MRKDDDYRPELIKLLELAFPSTPCGATVVYDLNRAKIDPEMATLQEKYSGMSWGSLEPGSVIRPIDSVLLLSAEAYFLLFPAYLRAALLPEGEMGRNESLQICDIVTWSIPLDEDEANEYETLKDDWWLSLSREQKIAVATVVVSALVDDSSSLRNFLERWTKFCVEDFTRRKE